MAKSGANYMNSQLIKMEALLNGFAEGIALDDRGYVSEGSGENIFTVSNGIVNTPPLSSSVLPGITRDSVIQICGELGITIKERAIQRAALYIADELFFSGTAAEITPIRSVDRIQIGSGERGEITAKIQKVFFEITSGERPAPGPWLTYVREQKARAANQPATGTANNGRNSKAKGKTESGATPVEPELVARAHAAARD
jgi:branched-chain amino acid aminotransferase